MKKRDENPLQGKLFMTAREIMDTHGPAEGDRMFAGTRLLVHGGGFQPQPKDLGRDPRAGEVTQRNARTDEVANMPTHDEQGNLQYRRRHINLMEKVKPETDEQMWGRKLEEAQDPGRGGHKQSLVEHLKGGGEIPPIPLGLLRNPYGHSGDKPMVAGGQHRVAAMSHLNPDQLLPVVPHKDIREAKDSEGYS